MKRYIISFILLYTAISFPQSLINSYPFPQYNPYNYFWGPTKANGNFWITSDFTGSAPYVNSWVYKVSPQGVILDSIVTPLKSIHGIDWDGSGFWIAEGYRAQGSRIYKMNMQGVLIDSFFTPTVIGGAPIGIGDVKVEANKVWFTVFSPDFVVYPNGYAYAFDKNTKLMTDTIPLRGRQVVGMAIKGDTVFYVNDNQYTGEVERIYAYSRTTHDTIFSFAPPDPDGTCNPRGLYWDGRYLWLIAERIGNSQWVFKTLYQYDLNIQGSPIISTNTNNVDFGKAVIGSNYSSYTLSVINNGTAKLIINNLQMTNNDFTIPGVTLPDTINPGSFFNYEIKFSPSAYDSIFGSLNISSNDGGTPVKTISLSAISQRYRPSQ